MTRTLFDQVWHTTRPAWANPPARWRVLLVLAALAEGEPAEAVITVGRVADYAGIGPRQARRYLAELQAEGWVEVTEPGRGQGCPNVYRITIPSGWAPARTGAWWEIPADK